MNEYVQLACLPPKQANNFPMANTKVYAAGWGLLSGSGISSNALQNVEINVDDGSECSYLVNFNWKSQICAGDYDVGIERCTGNSGAPIFSKEIFNGTFRHVLVGIYFVPDDCSNDEYFG